MPTIAEFLPWDSDFFQARIGRACGTRLTEDGVRELAAWSAENRIDCLYFLADSTDRDTIRIAEDNQFRLVDIRVLLGRRLCEAFSAEASERIGPAQPADIAELRRIAAQSHGNSRFFNDPRFSRERCTALYQTWIERSCRDYADAVLVIRDEGQVRGYITCNLREKSGQIGLIAVDAESRGAGLGSELIQGALQWFQKQAAAEVTVVTQGANTAALRMYERCGFTIRSVELWYHRWFLPEAIG